MLLSIAQDDIPFVFLFAKIFNDLNKRVSNSVAIRFYQFLRLFGQIGLAGSVAQQRIFMFFANAPVDQIGIKRPVFNDFRQC
ncbi:MAG: hypothetical protein IPG54_15115 [Sphingomonadales bacterium]|nr:hypothetical protein [Sphingomonadales bacterium]